MTEKIDTQGMSGEATEGCTDNIYPRDENGEPIYPPQTLKYGQSLMIKKEQS
tara:strand:+ start:51 stop:206 length:156 start_codon:yes stop_codon:yes gene_type:complete